MEGRNEKKGLCCKRANRVTETELSIVYIFQHLHLFIFLLKTLDVLFI